MTEFKPPIQGRVDREDWPQEANDEWERDVDRGVPPAEARRRIAEKYGVDEEQQILPDAVEAGKRMYSETTTPSMHVDSLEERAAAGALKDKRISQQGNREAWGLDKPDDSHLDLAPAAKVEGDRAKAFIEDMIDDIGSFDVKAYLKKYPEKTEEARELGFLREHA
jgi:hypothetical protein